MSPFFSLKLDPSFAVFYGLPAEIPFRFPETYEPGADPGVELYGIARAIAEFRSAHPDTEAPELRRFLAAWPRIDQLERYLAIGNHTFARRVAGELVAAEPDLPCARLGLGIAASRLELFDESVEALEAVLSRCPDRSDALIELALGLALQGRWDGARLMLDRLSAFHPGSADARLYRPPIESEDRDGLVRLRAIAARLADAERARRFDAAVPAAGELLEAFPGIAEATRRAAVVYRRAGDPARAMALAQRAARQDDRSPPVWVTLSRLHLESGDFIEAERSALRARSLAPGWKPAVIALARALRADSRSGIAALHLGEAVAAHQDDRELAELFGLCLLESGKIGEARAEFQKLAERESYDPLSIFNLGRVAEAAGDPASAEESYRTAIERAPRFAAAREALAVLRGRHGRFALARENLEELIRDRPESPFGYRGMGDILVDVDAAEALRFYEEARQRSPDLPAAGLYFLSGNKCLIEKEFAEAGRLFELSLSMDRRRHRSWCNLGVARFREGRLGEAIAAMEEAAHLDPLDPGYHRNLGTFYRSAFSRNPLGNIRCLWRSLRASRRAAGLEKRIRNGGARS